MVGKRPFRFRAYADRKRTAYYTVRIFARRDEMQAWCRQHVDVPQGSRVVPVGSDEEARAHAHQILRLKDGRWRRQPDAGWIVFHRGWLGAGIVSHEMTHAALYYLSIWRPQLYRVLLTSKKADEALAWVQGNLVAQFWDAYYRKKLGREPRPRTRY